MDTIKKTIEQKLTTDTTIEAHIRRLQSAKLYLSAAANEILTNALPEVHILRSAIECDTDGNVHAIITFNFEGNEYSHRVKMDSQT